MRALIQAGVLHVFGPGLQIDCDQESGQFVAASTAVPTDRVLATTLIEARLPETNLRRTTDPLIGQLLADGQCRAHQIPLRDGGVWQTGGLAVTERPCRVIDEAGNAHRRRFAIGVPTESVHWATAAGIRPGVNSVTIGDTDAVAPRGACAVPGTAGSFRRPVPGRAMRSATQPDEVDGALLSPVRAGTPIEAVVSDHAWLQAMLDAEAGLARAQAALGVLPVEAAEVIASAADADQLDLLAISRSARATANPVVGLIAALTEQVAAKDPTAADYVHRGSTSQDIFDTGAMLVSQRAGRLIVADLRTCAESLAAVATEHRDTPMAAGRWRCTQCRPPSG